VFASSCFDQELVLRTNTFIQDHIQTILERSPELSRFPAIIVDIIGIEPSNLSSSGEKPLCKLVVDWLETAAEETPVSKLAENPLILYLTSDNNLRDCLEVELDLAGINNINIVRDYKKLGKRKMMTPLRGKKDKVNNSGRLPNSSSSSFLNGNSSSSESLLSTSGETSLVATKRMGDKSFMCLAMLNDVLTRISIKFQPQNPSGLCVDSPSVVAGQGNGTRSPKREDLNGVPSPIDKQCSLTPLAPMSSARCGLGAGVVNGQLIAVGGYDRGECLSSVESFCLHTNSWTMLKPMLDTRARFTVAEMDGRLYACGGSNGHVDLKSAEFYDPDTGVWMALPDMSIQRSYAGVAAADGRVYVIGGWSGCSGRALCEIYDVKTDTWQRIADLNVGRSQVAVCALDDGRIVAVGGCDAWNCMNTVEIYDPATDRWSYLPPMAVARRGAGVAFFKNKLYVVGGSDGQTSLVSVETFDFSGSGLWSAGPSLGTPRASMGVAVVHRRLFAVGGFSGKAFLDTMEYLSDNRDEWCAYQPNVDVNGTELEPAAAPFNGLQNGTVTNLSNGDEHDSSVVESYAADFSMCPGNSDSLVQLDDEVSVMTTSLALSSQPLADQDSEAEL
jgi:influenza virus NS1A-binding protein